MDFILKSGQVLSHRKPKLMISLESVIPFFNIYIWFRIKVKVYIILFYCLESTPYCSEILFYNWRFQFFINALFHWSANIKFQFANSKFELDKLFFKVIFTKCRCCCLNFHVDIVQDLCDNSIIFTVLFFKCLLMLVFVFPISFESAHFSKSNFHFSPSSSNIVYFSKVFLSN